jgi:hypothetical protein
MRVCTDEVLREELKRKGRERVKNSIWEEAARQLKHIFEEQIRGQS